MSSEKSSIESTKSTQSSKKKEKPKKVSHYRDLFKLYFQTLSQRKLMYLYLPFIDEDVYILSNVPPYELLADNHDAAYAYVDLSLTEPYFKDLVRDWFRDCFYGYDICVRLDYFLQVTDRYFGPKIIPGQELLEVKGEYPEGEYPNFKKCYDVDNEHNYYILPKGEGGSVVTVAWDTSEGFSTLPIHHVYKDFKKFLKDPNIDMYSLSEHAFPYKDEEFTLNKLLYRLKPLIGFDALDVDKCNPDKSALAVLPVSNRAIQYCHLVSVNNVTIMVTRPNRVLFPKNC